AALGRRLLVAGLWAAAGAGALSAVVASTGTRLWSLGANPLGVGAAAAGAAGAALALGSASPMESRRDGHAAVSEAPEVPPLTSATPGPSTETPVAVGRPTPPPAVRRRRPVGSVPADPPRPAAVPRVPSR